MQKVLKEYHQNLAKDYQKMQAYLKKLVQELDAVHKKHAGQSNQHGNSITDLNKRLHKVEVELRKVQEILEKIIHNKSSTQHGSHKSYSHDDMDLPKKPRNNHTDDSRKYHDDDSIVYKKTKSDQEENRKVKEKSAQEEKLAPKEKTKTDQEDNKAKIDQEEKDRKAAEEKKAKAEQEEKDRKAAEEKAAGDKAKAAHDKLFNEGIISGQPIYLTKDGNERFQEDTNKFIFKWDGKEWLKFAPYDASTQTYKDSKGEFYAFDSGVMYVDHHNGSWVEFAWEKK